MTRCRLERGCPATRGNPSNREPRAQLPWPGQVWGGWEGVASENSGLRPEPRSKQGRGSQSLLTARVPPGSNGRVVGRTCVPRTRKEPIPRALCPWVWGAQTQRAQKFLRTAWFSPPVYTRKLKVRNKIPQCVQKTQLSR